MWQSSGSTSPGALQEEPLGGFPPRLPEGHSQGEQPWIQIKELGLKAASSPGDRALAPSSGAQTQPDLPGAVGTSVPSVPVVQT